MQIQAMLTEAVRHHQAGRLDQAAPLYQRVLTLEPNNPEALNLLGMAAMQNGQHQAGIELIRRAIAVNGRQSAYHFNLGVALQTVGAMEDAVASFRRALVLKPGDADTYNNLGNALAALGKLDEAQTAFRKALSLDPNNPAVLNNLGTVFWTLERKDEAEEHYRRALALKPDYADALVNLGNALRDKADLSGAMDCYRRALALSPDNAAAHNSLGLSLWNLGRRDEAMASYQKALALGPNQVEALANMGNALWENGALDQADALYRRALPLRPSDPGLLNNFAALAMARGDGATALEAIRRSLAVRETRRTRKLFVELAAGATWGGSSPEILDLMIRALIEPWDRPGKLSLASAGLIKQNPAIAPLIERANQAWPKRLSASELLGEAGFTPLAQDGLLMALLASAPNTDMALERFLTLVRAAMLNAADGDLGFAAALAQQCFINEYVFLAHDDEIAAAKKLRDTVATALESGSEIAPLALLTVAAYFPLFTLPHAEKLSARAWPLPVEAVLAQQLCEPLEERRLAAEIPRLTPIQDDVSRKVQAQYEENPYPRWVRVAEAAKPDNIINFLSEKYPFAAFERQPGRVMKDFLVAGCGTGQHSISTAQKFGDRAMLAVDLSLASLSYAKRKSRERGLEMEYGQADILELGALTRDFDVIESIGVLHHMKDPFAGWKALLSRLRPHGFMWLGFYSQAARRNIVEAGARIAEQNLGAADIRRFRQELADGKYGDDFASVFKSEDFYSVSACRDLLFHTQEHRLTLPAIAEFLKQNNLSFLGFELDDAVLQAYRQRFPHDKAATDLASWDSFETENPGMFAGLYVFWVQKA
jgi:Flp pilus assembly protein TadD/2-polyprenyl-3-methyl-5-hydroxy-6-metoxy-1,4-benzoquinol methylase